MNTRLCVWWETSIVGELACNESGDLCFTYDNAWLENSAMPALSLSLPKREVPFSRHEARPFFSGLLPEGDPRSLIARRLGISDKNDYALLEALGGDVAGILTLLPPAEVPPVPPFEYTHTPYDDDALLDVLRRLPEDSFYGLSEGMRFSLAGAQSKLPVVLANGRISLPAPGEATTFILKPSLPRFPGNVANEAFCLRLASAIGLNAAHCSAHAIFDLPYLLVKRYDRIQDTAGLVRRLHQEDFCQALGIVPERKYQQEGGPNLRDCHELIQRGSTRPAQDIFAFLDATIFNAIIGNADAHGKNFSFLYRGKVRQIAPLYDLVSTIMYPQISNQFAMSLGKAANFEMLNEKSLDIWSEQLALKPAQLRRRIHEISAAVTREAEPLREKLADDGLDQPMLHALQTMITQRAERLSSIADRPT